MPAKILVVGDIMIDVFVHGIVERISPEAPVPVVREQVRVRCPGGAANVAANIYAMGGIPTLIGVAGPEWDSGLCRDDFPHCVLIDETRPTTTKTRIVCDGQQIVRIDLEETAELPPRIRTELLQRVSTEMVDCDVVVISDYAKGVISQFVATWIIGKAQELKKPVIVDPKQNLMMYAGATIITPNIKELKGTSAFGAMAGTGAYILLTKGPQGMTLFFDEDRICEIPADGQEIVDVTGAGDTVVAALAVQWAKYKLKMDEYEGIEVAARHANLAAGVAVSRRGTVAVTEQDIREHYGWDGEPIDTEWCNDASCPSCKSGEPCH